MTGLLIDAFNLRICMVTFDDMITEFLKTHPKVKTELKTRAIINGSEGWSKVHHVERKEFINKLCAVAVGYAKLYFVAFSFQAFDNTVRNAGYGQPFGDSYWLGAAMFIAALVQMLRRMHLVSICSGAGGPHLRLRRSACRPQHRHQGRRFARTNDAQRLDIVECIAYRGRATPDEDVRIEYPAPRRVELPRATMPRIPLGPTECGSLD